MVDKAPTTRKQLNIRVTDQAKELLERLTADMGLSQTSVVELALRDLAKSRGLKLPKP